MNVLAIDTATNCGGVALSCRGKVIGLVIIKEPLRYSDTILDMTDFLLKQNCLSLEKIDCFAVSTGPGSFTGVRIGVTTIKSFCQAFDRPVVGISTLESLAYRFRQLHGHIAPMMDAGRQQIYGGLFKIEDSSISQEQAEQVMAPDIWLQGLPEKDYTIVGDGPQHFRDSIKKIVPRARVMETDMRIVDQLCSLAYQRFKQGKASTFHKLAVNYVRPPDIRKQTQKFKSKAR